MSINTSGTTPGLETSSETPAVVSMRCKVRHCESMSFTSVKTEAPEHQGLRVYRCTKCGDLQTISVGGHFSV